MLDPLLIEYEKSRISQEKQEEEIEYHTLERHEAAFIYFEWILKNYGFKIENTKLESYGRHKIYYTRRENKKYIFYLKYDKEFFHTFNYQFQEFTKNNPEYAGYGESINTEYLEKAINIGTNFIIFMNNKGQTYFIDPILLKHFCKKHDLKRTQNKTNKYTKPDYTTIRHEEKEETYSFPINILTNWIYIEKENKWEHY